MSKYNISIKHETFQNHGITEGGLKQTADFQHKQVLHSTPLRQFLCFYGLSPAR